MFIVALHDITNKQAFSGAGDAVVNDAPQGVKPLQFFPSTDGKQAVCLWEARSVDAVKDYLETKVAKCSRNTYYAVDSKVAMGLPVPA
jgi:hypothetical protein